MDTGQTAKLTNLTETPYAVYWSPDGEWMAFTMFVPEAPKPFVSLPAKPEGAKWAELVGAFTDEVRRLGPYEEFRELCSRSPIVPRMAGGETKPFGVER